MRNRFGARRFATIFRVSPPYPPRMRLRGGFARSSSKPWKFRRCKRCTPRKRPLRNCPPRATESTASAKNAMRPRGHYGGPLREQLLLRGEVQKKEVEAEMASLALADAAA